VSPIRTIQSQVAQHYGLTIAELVGPKRHRPLVYHRKLAMYLARVLTGASYPAIARAFKGRDHTTVMWAVKAVEKRLAADDGDLAATAEVIAIAVSATLARWQDDPAERLAKAVAAIRGATGTPCGPSWDAELVGSDQTCTNETHIGIATISSSPFTGSH